MSFTLPGYEIKQAVYHGIKFSVYSATRESDQQPVFLKRINADYPDVDDIARLQHEAEIAALARSENIIEVYDYVEHHHQIALVMQAVENGVSLDTLIKVSPMSTGEFLTVALKVVQGIIELHKHQIIHKDIKPANIVLSSDFNIVKIIDFGISVRLERETTDSAYQTILEGSPPYLPPEQTGKKNIGVDYRADFYALGCTLYEMLTGKTPFNYIDKEDWINAHLHEVPEAPITIDPDIPLIISEIVMKLINKDPDDRYQSSLGIYHDLSQCQLSLWQHGKINTFPLGQKDLSDRFMVSNKLYGRDREMCQLKSIITQTKAGKNAIIAVKGEAGVGKTSLVDLLKTQMGEEVPFFISGKFDQYRRNMPYLAISTVIRKITQQILKQNKQQQKKWADKLDAALGDNAKVILELAPLLSKLIKTPPRLSELPPKECENRFYSTINTFFQVFAKPEHPLVLFLDDIQWARIPSIKILEHLLTSGNSRALTIIIAYRSNEVGQNHPVDIMLDELKDQVLLNEVSIDPLKLEDINQLIADTLHCAVSSSQHLAEIIFEKTCGHPFYTNKLLETLYQDNHINYNYDLGQWTYNLDAIKKIEVDEDVAQFIVARLRKLSINTQNLLSIASCFGTRFRANMLLEIAQLSTVDIVSSIQEAVADQVIVPISGNYNLLCTQMKKSISEKIIFKFPHDRIQQAAYHLNTNIDKKEVHLKIGQIIIDEDYNDENCIDAANHLNKAESIINDSELRSTLAQLNLTAASQAINSTAYDSSLEFLDFALKFLPETAWKHFYEITWDIHFLKIKCLYLLGHFDQTDKIIRDIIYHSKTHIEKARVLCLKTLMGIALSDYDKAIDSGLNALRHFGINIEKQPSSISILLHFAWVRIKTFGRNLNKINQMPMITNDDQLMIMRLIGELLPAAYLSEKTNKSLYPMLTLKGVLFTLKHGLAKETGYVLVSFAVMLSAIFKDYRLAHQYGILGKNIVEKFSAPSFKCRMHFVYALFILPWHESLQNMYPEFKKSLQYGIISGDHQYLSYAAMHISFYDQQLNFSERIEAFDKYLRILDKTEHYDVLMQGKLIQHFWLNLTGKLNNDEKLSGKGFDEEAYFKRTVDNNISTSIAQYYLLKMIVCFYHRKYDQAMSYLYKLDQYQHFILGMALNIDYSLFGFLAISNFFSKLDAKDQKKALKRLKLELRKVKNWARHNPDSFHPIQYLMEAELAKLNKQHNIANKYYMQASKAAKDLKYMRYDALICEQHGYYLDHCDDVALQRYALDRYYEACVLNHRLGFTVKYQQLDPILKNSPEFQSMFDTPPKIKEQYLTTL